MAVSGPADRDQPVRAGPIVAAIPNDTAARTFYVAPGHLGPP